MDDKNKIEKLKKQLDKDLGLLKQYKTFYERTTNMPHLGLDSVIHDHLDLKEELKNADQTKQPE